jgi:hypothetical protein
MDPARMFKESLTSRPELENSQGQKRTWKGSENDLGVGRTANLSRQRGTCRSRGTRKTPGAESDDVGSMDQGLHAS